MTGLTQTLNILPFFLNIAADKWLDWDNQVQTGRDLFNQLAIRENVPPCEAFTCGAQGVSEGVVSLFIEEPQQTYSGYGINSSKRVSSSFSISLMLPSGSFAADRLKQILTYRNILLTCIEALFSEQSGCISGFANTSIDLSYYTDGVEEFSPANAYTSVQNIKLTASVSTEAVVQGL